MGAAPGAGVDTPSEKPSENSSDGDLEDCYQRMLKVPEVAAMMDDLGVERAVDLRELDEEDIAALVQPLKKVAKSKLLRVLGMQSAP